MLDVSASPPPAGLDAVFFALSDQTRRGLLGRLRGVELTAGALADGFQVTRPAVSRHLRILREAQLVTEKRRGRERVYTLTPEPLAGATTWLEDYRVFWSARLADLKALIESLPDDPSDADATAAAVLANAAAPAVSAPASSAMPAASSSVASSAAPPASSLSSASPAPASPTLSSPRSLK